MLLFLAALPTLFWDAPPDTAPTLRDAGITAITVPQPEAWKNVQGITATLPSRDGKGAVKLRAPGVNYRMDVASASRIPWLDSNGWRFLRNPAAYFQYEVKGAQSAIAAAESFMFGADAMLHTDSAGLKSFAEMLAFLRGIEENGAGLADIGFFDDGSSVAGEVMNMMARNNLLFRITPKADPALKLTFRLGTKEFPLERAKNPAAMAQEIRSKLTDERRSVRIFGSAVVVVRLTSLRDGVRVQLLNYAGAERKVDGVRVRVLVRFATHRVVAAGIRDAKLLDFAAESDATEFTLPELKTYAVIDLTR